MGSNGNLGNTPNSTNGVDALLEADDLSTGRVGHLGAYAGFVLSQAAVVVSSDAKTAYMAASGWSDAGLTPQPTGPGALIAVNLRTMRTESPIGLPVYRPAAIALSPNGHTAYVANAGRVNQPGSVSAVDLGSRRVLWSTSVSPGLNAIAISADGKTAYVTNGAYPEANLAGELAEVDLETRQVARIFSVPTNPAGLAVSGHSSDVYVASYGPSTLQPPDATLSIVDLSSNSVRALVNHIRQIPDPTSLVVGSSDGIVYLLATDGVVAITNPPETTPGTFVPVADPVSMQLSPDGHAIWVLSSVKPDGLVVGSGLLTPIDLNGFNLGRPLRTGLEPVAFALATK